jgi:multidrug efflux pump subunit AcrA (membrane-fusion protein)
VVSNVDGVADEVNIHPGETFTGAPTMGIKIVNTRNLKVVTNIPENYLSRVSKGTPVIVTIPDVNKTFKSSISLVSQAIGALSRGFIVEAKIPSDQYVKPNQIASIKIQDYSRANAVTVPVNTLQSDESGKFVLVAVKEGDKMVARKRESFCRRIIRRQAGSKKRFTRWGYYYSGRFPELVRRAVGNDSDLRIETTTVTQLAIISIPIKNSCNPPNPSVPIKIL